MADTRRGVVARRLSRVLFWAALAFAVGFPAYVLVARVHDTVVVQRDVACYERETAALSACAGDGCACGDPASCRRAAADRCRIDAVAEDPAHWVSRNGWAEHRLVDLRPSETTMIVLLVGGFAGLPLLLLVVLGAAYRWMARPAREAR